MLAVAASVAVAFPAVDAQARLGARPPEAAFPAPTAQVMLLGAFHFDNPGLDAYRERQAPTRLVEPHVAAFERADTADAWRARHRRWRAWEDSMRTTRTLAAHLRHVNDPATIRRDHGSYLTGFFTVGGDSSYVGPDFIAGWFDRNLRIFRNLQRITDRPDERILVVYGAGHLATLRHLVESSPEYRLVEATEYLGR